MADFLPLVKSQMLEKDREMSRGRKPADATPPVSTDPVQNVDVPTADPADVDLGDGVLQQGEATGVPRTPIEAPADGTPVELNGEPAPADQTPIVADPAVILTVTPEQATVAPQAIAAMPADPDATVTAADDLGITVVAVEEAFTGVKQGYVFPIAEYRAGTAWKDPKTGVWYPSKP